MVRPEGLTLFVVLFFWVHMYTYRSVVVGCAGFKPLSIQAAVQWEQIWWSGPICRALCGMI